MVVEQGRLMWVDDDGFSFHPLAISFFGFDLKHQQHDISIASLKEAKAKLDALPKDIPTHWDLTKPRKI
jgi:hypothetical protein